MSNDIELTGKRSPLKEELRRQRLAAQAQAPATARASNDIELTGKRSPLKEELRRQRLAAPQQMQMPPQQMPAPPRSRPPTQGPQGPRYALSTNPAKEQKRRLKRLARHVPPKRKSLNVRVDDAVFAALTALQDASGQSRAQLVAQIILEAFARLYPSWSQLAQLRAAMPR